MNDRFTTVFVTMAALAFLGGCATVEVQPEPEPDETTKSSQTMRKALTYCGPSRAFGCVERVACSADFPRQPDRHAVSYNMIAGVDRLTVIVEPQGFVSEIRRMHYADDGGVSHSSTPCAENRLAMIPFL